MVRIYEKINNIKINNSFLLIASFTLVLLFLAFDIYSFVIVLILISIIFKIETRNFILIIVIALSTLISDINENLRITVVLMIVIFLIFTFLKKYGTTYNKFPLVQRSLLIYFFILATSFLISIIFSIDISNSIIELLRTILFFILIYIIYSLINNVKDLVYLIIGLVISTIIISISIWVSFINSGNNIASLIAKNQFRVIGLYSNVNAPGSYIIATLPFLIAIINYSKLIISKYLIFTIILLLTTGILLTASRSAFLGTFVGVSIAIYLTNKKLFKVILISFILVVCFFILVPKLNELISFYLRFDSGLTYRQDLWEISYGIFKDYPFTGIGPGNYTEVMLKYFPLMFDSWKSEIIFSMMDVTYGSNLSHNFYIAMLSDLGILGIISAIYLTFIFFSLNMNILNYFKEENKKLDYYLIVGAFAGGVGIFIRSFFEGIGIMTYGWIKMDLPFWLLFIVILFFCMKNKSATKEK